MYLEYRFSSQPEGVGLPLRLKFEQSAEHKPHRRRGLSLSPTISPELLTGLGSSAARRCSKRTQDFFGSLSDDVCASSQAEDNRSGECFTARGAMGLTEPGYCSQKQSLISARLRHRRALCGLPKVVAEEGSSQPSTSFALTARNCLCQPAGFGDISLSALRAGRRRPVWAGNVRRRAGLVRSEWRVGPDEPCSG